MTKIKELCLAGAANRGICYIGVLACLIEHDLLELTKLYGVSIGSFIGVLYLIGYTIEEMMETVLKQDISDFQDISVTSLLTCGSVLEGGKYRLWIMQVLDKKIDHMITFKSLYNKNKVFLNISAVSLDSGEDGLEYFNHEMTPDMPVYYAILASMSVPLIFPPFLYKNKRYVDGALLENFPMHLLSKDGIGFWVTNKQEEEVDVSNSSYIIKMMDLIATRMRKLTKYEGTVYKINADDYGLISFVLSLDNKITLYYRGYTAALGCVKEIKEKEQIIEKEEIIEKEPIIEEEIKV
jgi:NTE family protein